MVETAQAAQALVEDLSHIREVLARRATSKAEIRRLSSVIRRLLVDGDLINVAAPRVGKLLVLAPDRKSWYEAEKYVRVMFFASGGMPVFGVHLRSMSFLNAGQVKTIPSQLTANLQTYQETTVSMRLDNFLSQRVLCLDGRWVSRRAAIKHIANYGSGVHSKTPDTPDDEVCHLLRNCCTYSVEGPQVKVHMLPHLGNDSFPGLFNVDPPWTGEFPVDVLDPVLLEVLAAGAFITASPSVKHLESIISRESQTP